MPYPENTNWGLPDWQSETAYGNTDSWSNDRWRWEFTRRREDYRADFDAHAQQTYERALAVHTSMGHPAAKVLKPDDPGFSVGSTLALKYDLCGGMPNPRISEQPPHCILFHNRSVRFYTGSGKDLLEGDTAELFPIPEGWMGAILDLSKPWTSQADHIKAHFEFLQGERGKVIRGRGHKNNWLRYLRVLDGREAKASWSVLADVAASNSDSATPQNAKQVWEAAQSLMFNWPP